MPFAGGGAARATPAEIIAGAHVELHSPRTCTQSPTPIQSTPSFGRPPQIERNPHNHNGLAARDRGLAPEVPGAERQGLCPRGCAPKMGCICSSAKQEVAHPPGHTALDGPKVTAGPLTQHEYNTRILTSSTTKIVQVRTRLSRKEACSS